jgi:hypothetical protein
MDSPACCCSDGLRSNNLNIIKIDANIHSNVHGRQLCGCHRPAISTESGFQMLEYQSFSPGRALRSSIKKLRLSRNLMPSTKAVWNTKQAMMIIQS